MCWSIVMMQLPVCRRPEVWSFAPNCITESAENLLIVLFCHCLSYRCVFVMHNSTVIKEHSFTLILLCTCLAFFGLGDSGCFHCDDCAFVSGSYPYTHVSSPVITVFRNSGSVLVVSSRFFATFWKASFGMVFISAVAFCIISSLLSKRDPFQVVPVHP